MATKYIRLMEEYKLAMKKGETERAHTIFRLARELLRGGKVSDEEIEAAMYL